MHLTSGFMFREFFFVESSGPPHSHLVMKEKFKGKEEKTSEEKFKRGEKEITVLLDIDQEFRLRLYENKHKPSLVCT